MVVTVDLLTTGIDVPEITTLVFMRRIKSRILFEQMLGRATRLCPAINKTHFDIYDPVGVYESLQDVSGMKPVVTSPSTSFEDLLNGLSVAKTDDERAYLVDTIVAKLQRKRANVSAKALEHFINLTGGQDIDGIAKSIRSNNTKKAVLAGEVAVPLVSPMEMTELVDHIMAHKEALLILDKDKTQRKRPVIIDDHPDEVIEHNSYYLNDGQMTADISDDLPFDIPDSWCWARLKDVLIINPRNKLDDTLDVAFIPMPLIDDGYSGKHTAEVRPWKEVKTGFTHFAEGDVGVAKITPCFENRKSTVFENLSNGYGAGTTELHILRPYGKTILAKYLLAYVKSDYFVENGKQTFSGAVGQQRIGKEYVEGAYFPIPPIKEQERIVQQINTAFECLNTIADALS